MTATPRSQRRRLHLALGPAAAATAAAEEEMATTCAALISLRVPVKCASVPAFFDAVAATARKAQSDRD